jgi:hypothetical protein
VAPFNNRLYQLGPQGIGVGVRDVQIGSNQWGSVPGFLAEPGYDQATGWGTPDIAKLVSAFTEN